MTSAPAVQLAIDGRRIELLDLPGDQRAGALVLLHEGLGCVQLWRGLPEDLQRRTGRRVIAFSRFGHGRSQPPARPRTPQFFHDEALGVLPVLRTELELANPVLIGHSDGGSIALVHAAHHPVAGLVLIAPHVFVEPITVAAIRQTREAFLSGPLRERLARYHDDVEAAFWGWCDVWLDPDFETWNLEGETARVSAPTLLIQGADDPYGTLEQLERIQVHLPGARRLVVPGGHSPHLEQREVVLDAIADFLTTVS